MKTGRCERTRRTQRNELKAVGKMAAPGTDTDVIVLVMSRELLLLESSAALFYNVTTICCKYLNTVAGFTLGMFFLSFWLNRHYAWTCKPLCWLHALHRKSCLTCAFPEPCISTRLHNAQKNHSQEVTKLNYLHGFMVHENYKTGSIGLGLWVLFPMRCLKWSIFFTLGVLNWL